MMNYIWLFMVLLGLAFSAANGSLGQFSEGLMGSCGAAITFVIGLAGVMAMWSGFMNIARQTGLMEVVAKVFRPVLKRLFPDVINQEVTAAILMSFIANLFGAGNSATVFSLKSMELLDQDNGGRETASNAMCMFVAMSMSMVQLVPITALKIMSDHGASRPESIILPSFLAGLATLALSVALCKWFEGADRWRRAGRGQRHGHGKGAVSWPRS